MAVVVVTLHGGFLDGSVHALDLAVGPGVIGFGQTMFDSTAKTDAVEGMTTEASRWSSAVPGQVGELNTVVGQHGVDAIGNGRNQRFQKRGSSAHVCAFDQFNKGELRGTVDSHEQIEFAFSGANLGQVDMEVADRVALELLPVGLAAFHFRKTADAMPFQATMQRRTGQPGNGGLEGIETVVQRQQGVSAKSNDNCLFF